MTARSYAHGHPVEHNGRQWVYSDTRQPATVDRACVRCGRKPTPDGHDVCLGTIAGCTSACCGHGVEEPYST